jgi:predicted DNA-binding transcriptional regulator AlpA
MSVKDLQNVTGFKRTAIYDKVASGRIPYLKFDTTIKFDPIAIAAWMREHTTAKAA